MKNAINEALKKSAKQNSTEPESDFGKTDEKAESAKDSKTEEKVLKDEKGSEEPTPGKVEEDVPKKKKNVN